MVVGDARYFETGGYYMRAILVCSGIIAALFSPCIARGQDANDPSKLRADIARSESEAALTLEQDVEDLAKSAEDAAQQEVERDSAEAQALRAEGGSVRTATAVSTLDDSNASIEKDISSLESQERSLDAIK